MSAIQVVTNTFHITHLPKNKYKQYDAWSTADHTEVFAQKKNQLFYHLMNIVDPHFFNPRMIYDGRALAYTPKDMGPGRQWCISLGSTTVVEPTKKGAVTVRITATASTIIDPKHVMDLIHDRKATERSAVATNLMQLIIRQAANMNRTNNGRAYFTEEHAKTVSGAPFELWHGIFQSVRPTIGRMVLNVDKATAVVYRKGRLDETAMDFLNLRNKRDLILQDRSLEYKKLESHLKGIEIDIPAMGQSKYRRKKIRGLIVAAGDFKFRTDEGRQLTVADYYRSTYGITIQFPRIVGVRLTGKHHPRPQVVPMEVCNVVPGQLYKKKLPESLVAEMVRFSVTKPAERLRLIKSGVQQHQTSVPLAEAGMRIDPNPIIVNGVMLEQPNLEYLARQIITPQNGGWNVMNKKLFSPKPLDFWAIINFCPDRIAHSAVNDIARMIQECAAGLGMGSRHPITIINGNALNVEGTLNDLKDYIVRNRPSTQDKEDLLKKLVFVILLPEHGGPIKTSVKYWGDIENGITVVCAKESKLLGNRSKSQYFNNIMLKINARLGGQNHIVNSHVLQRLAGKGAYMIMGADVGHPGVGVQRPSTTSLVYSTNLYGTQYAAFMGIQNQRQEYIEKLHDYVARAVELFGRANGPPVNIIFFRDGLSEGEFDKVARQEVSEIKKAIKFVFQTREVASNVPFPRITYIVVGKRHHITLYPNGREHHDRNGNCDPGTVVNSGITHPVERDFYLQSHAAIQGTSRSGHYTVILDEIFGPERFNEIQELSYALCHVYAKATRSVSIPAPVYYADLVCQRLNYHISPHVQDNLFDDGSTAASGSTPFDLSQWQTHFRGVHSRLAGSMYFL